MTWKPDPRIGPRVAALVPGAEAVPPSRGPGSERSPRSEPGEARRAAPATRGSREGGFPRAGAGRSPARAARSGERGASGRRAFGEPRT